MASWVIWSLLVVLAFWLGYGVKAIEVQDQAKREFDEWLERQEKEF